MGPFGALREPLSAFGILGTHWKFETFIISRMPSNACVRTPPGALGTLGRYFVVGPSKGLLANQRILGGDLASESVYEIIGNHFTVMSVLHSSDFVDLLGFQVLLSLHNRAIVSNLLITDYVNAACYALSAKARRCSYSIIGTPTDFTCFDSFRVG